MHKLRKIMSHTPPKNEKSSIQRNANKYNVIISGAPSSSVSASERGEPCISFGLAIPSAPREPSSRAGTSGGGARALAGAGWRRD